MGTKLESHSAQQAQAREALEFQAAVEIQDLEEKLHHECEEISRRYQKAVSNQTKKTTAVLAASAVAALDDDLGPDMDDERRRKDKRKKKKKRSSQSRARGQPSI